jgi:hypothetical protein
MEYFLDHNPVGDEFNTAVAKNIEEACKLVADGFGQLHANLEKPKSSKNESNHTTTFNQHPTPIFIASPKLSTHNDGLNRGTQETQILHP